MKERFCSKCRCKFLSGLFLTVLIIIFIGIYFLQNMVVIKTVQSNGKTWVYESLAYAREKHNLQFDSSRSDKQYDLRIIAMVFDRAHSLLRLLNSLNMAEYNKDSIKLEVWIDRSKNGRVDKKVVTVTTDFKFQHGDYSVHVYPTHVGIYGQWLNAWTPRDNSSEIALLLEDDIQVSPLFYKYLKAVHKKYDDYPKINGFALQGFSMQLANGIGDLKAPYEHQVFLYPILGCWGFSPSKKNWMKFLKWVKSIVSEGTVKPYVPGTIATGWYKSFERSGRKHTMWEMWHIYYAWRNNEYTLYANLKDHEGFSANWREEGLHFSKSDPAIGTPTNPLVKSWKPVFDKLPDNPVKLNMDSTVMKN